MALAIHDLYIVTLSIL